MLRRFSLPYTMRAFRHRNFRLYFIGQGISITGTWMTRIATSWLVYRLTHSAFLLGLVSFSGQIVSFLLGPFAGVWVERLDRRKLLIVTQSLAALQALTMAALTITQRITLWEIVILAIVQGILNAFDMPGRQSLLVQLVEGREDLANAIALNSSMVNMARLTGPAMAGALIGAVGEGWCFFFDGMSYLAVIASLVAVRLHRQTQKKVKSGVIEDIRDGWSYVTSFLPIRSILILLALVSLMGYPYMVLLPVFAGEVLHGGPHTLALLSAAAGAGALVSALSLVARKNVRGLIKFLSVSVVCLGGALILFGLSRSLWLSLFAMLFVGFGLIQTAAISNTLVQVSVSEEKRARAMSYYSMAFFGMMPFGSLLAGGLGHWVGAPMTVILTGAVCLIGAGWFWRLSPSLESAMAPIYQRTDPSWEKTVASRESEMRDREAEAETIL